MKDIGETEKTSEKQMLQSVVSFRLTVISSIRHKEANTGIRFLTQDEETKLLNTCGENLRAIVIGALNTGFRRAELLSLTWQDVDLERGLVTVQAAYAKNREKRSIPINRRLHAVLQSLKARGVIQARLS